MLFRIAPHLKLSLSDPIGTTTPQGRLVSNIFAALAAFGIDLIRERTQAGLLAARAGGRKGGIPKGYHKRRLPRRWRQRRFTEKGS